MGFLKKFFRNVVRDGSVPLGTSSFDTLSEEELEAHLGVSRYGDFMLTDAVRPSYDLQVVPCQGYRHDSYRDEENRATVPVLMGAVSQERLFEAFLDLLDPLGNVVDVVLETSHNRDRRGHQDLYREHIDTSSKASSGNTRICSCTTAAPAWPWSIPGRRRKSSSTSTSC